MILSRPGRGGGEGRVVRWGERKERRKSEGKEGRRGKKEKKLVAAVVSSDGEWV